MVVGLHIHAKANETHAFGLESESLLEAMFAGEENLASGSDHPLPRNASTAAVQGPCNLASVARVSGRVGDVAIRRDLAARNATDLGEEELKHLLRLLRRGHTNTRVTQRLVTIKDSTGTLTVI